MFAIRKLVLLAALPLGIAGCQTASRTPASLTTVTVPQAMVIAPPAPLQSPPPPLPRPPSPAPLPSLARSSPPLPLTNATSATPPPPPVANTWTALEDWGKAHGLPNFTQLTGGFAPSYQLRTPDRTLTVKIGSRIAQCDGLEFWLGFAPQRIQGVPHIHSLDAQKNLQPLASLSPTGAQESGGASGGNGAEPGGKSQRSVVIDPGHGGKDIGTQSVPHNEFEKNFTLDWARRLRDLLAANGWKVFLTRSNDTEVSLTDRVALAERVGADLFLSLHFNSGLPNRELAGLETYCLTPVGMSSHLVRDYADDPKQAFPNNAFDEENVQWAFRLHRAVLAATGAADRGVRRARFMAVLRGQRRPGVLIEAGYLSNPKEARQIALPAYRQRLAEAVARALE